MARFTTKQIDALRPTDKQFELSEPGGLRVRVYRSGRVVFVLRYRDPAGKQRVVTLGTYPAMGLAQARVELAKAQAARGTGTDPAEARTQQRQESRRRAQGRIQAPTVADVAERYLDDLAARVQRQERSAASLYEARRLIAKHVLPALGTERADEVTRQDVRAVLRKVATASTPTMADKVLVVLRALLNAALEDDTIAANPAGRIKKTVGRTSRDRVLADAEIAALWAELDRRHGRTAQLGHEAGTGDGAAPRVGRHRSLGRHRCRPAAVDHPARQHQGSSRRTRCSAFEPRRRGCQRPARPHPVACPCCSRASRWISRRTRAACRVTRKP